MDQKQAVQAVKKAPKRPEPLGTDQMTLTNGTANQRSLVAEYKAATPLVLDASKVLRYVLTAYDGDTTDGTAGNTETFNLSQDAIDTPNTTSFALFEGANQVAADSVDYAADTYDYTDDGTNNNLHAFYVAADQLDVEIVKKAPNAQGAMEQRVYSGQGGLVHQANQFKQNGGESWDISRSDNPLKAVVPRKWKLQVYAKAAYAVSWDDSDDANSDDVDAPNALLNLPVARLSTQIDGLSSAVRRAITDPQTA